MNRVDFVKSIEQKNNIPIELMMVNTSYFNQLMCIYDIIDTDKPLRVFEEDKCIVIQSERDVVKVDNDIEINRYNKRYTCSVSQHTNNLINLKLLEVEV